MGGVSQPADHRRNLGALSQLAHHNGKTGMMGKQRGIVWIKIGDRETQYSITSLFQHSIILSEMKCPQIHYPKHWSFMNFWRKPLSMSVSCWRSEVPIEDHLVKHGGEETRVFLPYNIVSSEERPFSEIFTLLKKDFILKVRFPVRYSHAQD
jgi:hypothetical protein